MKQYAPPLSVRHLLPVLVDQLDERGLGVGLEDAAVGVAGLCGPLGGHAHQAVAVDAGDSGLREELLLQQPDRLLTRRHAAPQDGLDPVPYEVVQRGTGADGLEHRRGGVQDADVLAPQDGLGLVQQVLDVLVGEVSAPAADEPLDPARVEVDGVEDAAAHRRVPGHVGSHHMGAAGAQVQPVAPGRNAEVHQLLPGPLEHPAPYVAVDDALGGTGGAARFEDAELLVPEAPGDEVGHGDRTQLLTDVREPDEVRG